jgi:hypothetical protein
MIASFAKSHKTKQGKAITTIELSNPLKIRRGYLPTDKRGNTIPETLPDDVNAIAIEVVVVNTA